MHVVLIVSSCGIQCCVYSPLLLRVDPSVIMLGVCQHMCCVSVCVGGVIDDL